MKTEPNTAAAEQSLPIRPDQQLTTAQRMLRLSATLAERELGEDLERWDDEGGACL